MMQKISQTEKGNIERQKWTKSWFLTKMSFYDRKTFLQNTPCQVGSAAFQLEVLSVLEKPPKISSVLKYHSVYLFVVTNKQLLPRFCGDQT